MLACDDELLMKSTKDLIIYISNFIRKENHLLKNVTKGYYVLVNNEKTQRKR